MQFRSKTRRAAFGFGSGIGIAIAAAAAPAVAQAQVVAPMTSEEIRTLPVEYQTAPAIEEFEERTIDANGVETITRTRVIESASPYPTGGHHYQQYTPAYHHAPAAAVFQRDQWIAECERRTANRGDSERGGIIGALLGAIGGGIAGNRIADAGDRLGGTLIGAGVGGLGGLLLGSLIGGGRNDRGDYDCEAALDSYLSQYGHGAARYIPAPAYAPAAPMQYGYGYAPPHYGYSYAPPQQIVYMPVHYQQQQRVVVTETVREEVIPGATRVVPPAPRPAPPRYIKGN